MKLSKTWTTVTPLSKTIALILFAMLPFVGFYLGYQAKSQKSMPVPVNTAKNDNSPEAVTNNFYQWYSQCIENHFANPNGKSPKENCPYRTSPLVSEKLNQALKDKKGFDPIFCAQEVPESISLGTATISGKQAMVEVNNFFSTEKYPLKVSLELNGQQWLITNITCRF